MRPTLALLDLEFRLLTRDTTAWSTAIALPLALGGYLAYQDPPIGDGVAVIVAMQVLALLALTLHTVGAMALASRRQQLVLKRWRGSQVSDLGLLAGSLGVPVLLALVQVLVLAGVTAAVTGARPVNVAVVLVAVLVATATVAALTFVVAAFTRSAEHAMLTTMPMVAMLAAGGLIGLTRPVGDLDWHLLAIPGTAAVHLIRLGWDGTAGDGSLLVAARPALIVSAALTVVSVKLALDTFRWEPRS